MEQAYEMVPSSRATGPSSSHAHLVVRTSHRRFGAGGNVVAPSSIDAPGRHHGLAFLREGDPQGDTDLFFGVGTSGHGYPYLRVLVETCRAPGNDVVATW